jgi:hypothetical protein
MTAAYTLPRLPLWESVLGGVVRAFQCAGLDPTLGARLHSVFARAGLDAPRLTLGAPAGASGDPELVAYLVESWRSILPAAQRLGAVPDEVAGFDTLAQRLRDEAAGTPGFTAMPALICASVRV